MQTELLAPAGDKEAAYSAFYFGADAIYLGLKHFSARAEAVNFSKDDLDEVTAYAHTLNKKVYVALNTLMQESELSLLMDTLQTCADCHVDAIIVQDLGVARLVKKCFPQLALHGSTQMAIHNLAGALALKKMGFERVVLARELTLNEIKHIQEGADIEIEVFVHGALCYSYSGLCSFSSLTTSRSANRGKCVYSCRDTFQLNERQYHPFSMKDLALEKDVLKLKGISLKIEGRKKNALYVGAVTDYYRRILDTGKTDISLSDNLKQIFARPWTKLHFNSKSKDVIEPDYVGHRGLLLGQVEKVFNQQITFKPSQAVARYDGLQIDLQGVEKPFGFSVENLLVGGKRVFEAAAHQTITVTLPPNSPFIKKGCPVYLSSSTRVKGSYAYTKPKPGAYKNKTPISVSLFITPTEIIACCGEKTASISGSFTSANQPEKVTAAVQSCFEKTGETPVFLDELIVHNKDNLFAPVSVLNEVRRALYEQMEFKKTTPDLPVANLTKQTSKAPKWCIKTDQPTALVGVDLTRIDSLIIEITPQTTLDDLLALPADKITLALPTIIRNPLTYQKIIDMCYQAGFTSWQIGNLGGLMLLPKKANISFDNTIGMLNSQAIAYAFELGAQGITFSVEDTSENITRLSHLTNKTSLVIYQDIPLFLSANCVRENECHDCNHQKMTLPLSNGKDKFELVSKDCLTTVVKETPFYIAPLVQDIPVDTLRLDFCVRTYTTETISRILSAAQNGTPLKNAFSGNFKKKFA